MNVAISGQAGFALLFEGKRLHSLHRDRPGVLVPRPPESLRLLLNGVDDLETFENIDAKRAQEELTLASARADGLHVSLILLDSSLPEDIRAEAAAELNDLLLDQRVAAYVEGVLWSHPLPADGDLPGAKRLAEPIAPRALRLLAEFEKDQSNIGLAWVAWQEIPAQLFRSEEESSQARAHAVRRGLFKWLVPRLSEHTNYTTLAAELLAHPMARKLPNYRKVCSAWLAPLAKGRAVARGLALRSYKLADELADPNVGGMSEWPRQGPEEAVDLVAMQMVASIEVAGRLPDEIPAEILGVIQRALAKLGPRYRQFLYLDLLERRSPDEIRAALNIRPAAYKMLKSRSFTLLREALSGRE